MARQVKLNLIGFKKNHLQCDCLETAALVGFVFFLTVSRMGKALQGNRTKEHADLGCSDRLKSGHFTTVYTMYHSRAELCTCDSRMGAFPKA